MKLLNQASFFLVWLIFLENSSSTLDNHLESILKNAEQQLIKQAYSKDAKAFQAFKVSFREINLQWKTISYDINEWEIVMARLPKLDAFSQYVYCHDFLQTIKKTTMEHYMKKQMILAKFIHIQLAIWINLSKLNCLQENNIFKLKIWYHFTYPKAWESYRVETPLYSLGLLISYYGALDEWLYKYKNDFYSSTPLTTFPLPVSFDYIKEEYKHFFERTHFKLSRSISSPMNAALLNTINNIHDLRKEYQTSSFLHSGNDKFINQIPESNLSIFLSKSLGIALPRVQYVLIAANVFSNLHDAKPVNTQKIPTLTFTYPPHLLFSTLISSQLLHFQEYIVVMKKTTDKVPKYLAKILKKKGFFKILRRFAKSLFIAVEMVNQDNAALLYLNHESNALKQKQLDLIKNIVNYVLLHVKLQLTLHNFKPRFQRYPRTFEEIQHNFEVILRPIFFQYYPENYKNFMQLSLFFADHLLHIKKHEDKVNEVNIDQMLNFFKDAKILDYLYQDATKHRGSSYHGEPKIIDSDQINMYSEEMISKNLMVESEELKTLGILTGGNKLELFFKDQWKIPISLKYVLGTYGEYFGSKIEKDETVF